MSEDLKFLLDCVEPWQWGDLEKELLPVLNDRAGAPDVRLAAVEIAGDFTQINDRLAGALLKIVANSDEPDDLRAGAAIAFGPALEQASIDEFDDPESVPISEEMFVQIQEALKRIFLDASVPKEVRRRVLEGSIRAPEDWHIEEVRKAYATGDPEWMLTAVFCMSHVRGFEKEVLEALESNNDLIHLEAVRAAGAFELEEAWPHIARLAESNRTEKSLRVAAIEALSTLRPEESLPILHRLMGNADEDIAEAADEAQSMASGFLRGYEDDGDFDGDEDDEDDDDFPNEKPKPVN
jgi:hypothetical protein